MVIVVPVFEVEQSGFYYNTAAVIDADGTYLGKYRKHHIPQVKGFWEKYYFKPGNLGWPVFDTAVGKVGVYICYDRHFPEGWRQLGLQRRPARLQPVGHPPRSLLPPLAAGAARRGRRQRVLRRRDQPGRRGGVRRQRLLRDVVLRRPARPVRRRDRERQERGTRRPRPRLRPRSRRYASSGRSTATAAPTPTKGWCSRDRRPAGPPPGRPARLARPLLRGPAGAHPRRGPSRLGRRGQQVPRLLRRHPHHDDRARPARGDQGGERAGRADHPLLHALPQPADGRTGRAHRQVVRHPGRARLLHDLRHRGQRHRPAAGHRLPPQQQILAMRNSYHGRSFSAVGITGNRAGRRPASPRSRRCTSTAASAPAARTPISTTPASSRPASTT